MMPVDYHVLGCLLIGHQLYRFVHIFREILVRHVIEWARSRTNRLTPV